MVQVHVGATPWRFESSQPHSEAVATLGCGRSLPLSSRGLGRRPLTAETGVRIPVAVLTDAPQQRGFRRLEGALSERRAPVMLAAWEASSLAAIVALLSGKRCR